ncbi:MAG: trehalase-like domain-containing protein, partial [Gemmatimonadota bacterium]
MTYKPLRDYGLIGDMRTAALVGRDGSIDWCCFPRFDGPSVFAALLDARRGGRWSVAPARGASGGAQAYEPGTNVLRTRFRSADVIDFMPVYRPRADVPLEIHRC